MTKKVRMDSPYLGLLNLFYRNYLLPFLIFTGLILSAKAYGVRLTAIYNASCKRDLGVVIRVSDREVSLLSTEGVIKKISRFDIIYMAQYPLGELPIAQVINSDLVGGVRIKTLFNGDLVTLVEGWPIEFSEEKISFVSSNGQESTIDRESIWSVDLINFPKNLKFDTNEKINYFVHPYPFRNCDPLSKKNATSGLIYPQKLLGERLTIKNELDRLRKGYEKILDYHRDQKFYPVPQVYSNLTSLGVWGNYGSRHGVSKKRTNNMIPAIVSEISEGPFGFQRLLVTGSHPMLFNVHEEPQTQFYYKLKADYVHFSFFYDIDRLLIGEGGYSWRLSDLNTYDDRMNQISHIAGGFDFGPYTLGIQQSTVQYAMRHKDVFFANKSELSGSTASYHDRYFKIQLFIAQGEDKKDTNFSSKEESGNSQEPEEIREAKEQIAARESLEPSYKGKIRFLRLNLTINNSVWQPVISFIYRDLLFYKEQNESQVGELTYKSTNLTGTIYIDYRVDEDIKVGSYLSFEKNENQSGISYYKEKNGGTYPKAGLNIALIF